MVEPNKSPQLSLSDELYCVGAGLPEPFVGQVERFQVEAEEGGFHREVPTPEYVWLMLRGH